MPSTDAVPRENLAGQMRACIVDAPGAEPRSGFVPRPEAARGATVLGVLGAPLNPLDLLIASGGFHSARHEEPYIPGSECVGVVLESETHPIGSLVYAELHVSPQQPGAFATHVSVPDADVLALPNGLDPILAAAVGNSGAAAYLPLMDVARLQPGETVLVLGASGAVGQLAVQIAHRQGAGRVIGVARDVAVLDRLLSLGADAVVGLREHESAEDLAARILAVSGGVDVVFDGIYGLPLEAALQVCGSRARVVNVGNLASPTVTLPAGTLRGKQLIITGYAGLHTSLADKSAALRWLWKAVSTGDIQLSVKTVTLEDLPAAWRAQATSPHVKYIVVPQEPERNEIR